jgi:DNA-binding XRE family transcriptional regulator
MCNGLLWNELSSKEKDDILKVRTVKFGDVLARRRSDLQMSQSDISQKLGYVRGSIVSAFENGRLRPASEKVREIAAIYQFDETRFYAVYIYLFHPDIWYMFSKMSVPCLSNNMLEHVEVFFFGGCDKICATEIYKFVIIQR